MRPLFILIILFTSCSSYEPMRLDEVAILDDLRRTTIEIPPEGVTAKQAVAIALVHNPDLAVWRQKHDIAAGLIISEAAWKNPEFRPSIQNIYSRAANPLTFAFDLRIFPPAPGEIAAKVARAKARERRVLAEIENQERDLAMRTRIAISRLSMLDQKIEIAKGIGELHDRLHSIVTEQVEAGAATVLDGTLIQLQKAKISDEASSIVAERKKAQAELAGLLGAAPTATIKVIAAPPSADTPILVQTVLEDRALHHRPDLRALKERYEEAESRLELVHISKSFWPQFLQLALGGVSKTTDFGLDGSIELPIFDSGKADIAVAESKRSRARAAFRAAVHHLRGDLRLAALNFLEQARRRQFLNQQLRPVLLQAEQLLRSLFDSGSLEPLKLIAVESRVWEARRDGAEANFQYERSRIVLSASLGGIYADI